MNNESEYTSSVLIVIWLRPSQVKLFQLTFAILVHAMIHLIVEVVLK